MDIRIIKDQALGQPLISGGTKAIYSLRDEKAVVALPNRTNKATWDTIIRNEIKNSILCKKLGLMTQDYQLAYIENGYKRQHGLFMPSFHHLAMNGRETRDHKAPGLANYGNTMLFGKKSNISNKIYLKHLLMQLIPDIVTAIYHGIPANSDTINLMINGKCNEKQLFDSQTQQLRLFFYDFTFTSEIIIDNHGNIDHEKIESRAWFYLYRAYYCLGSSLLASEEKLTGVSIGRVDKYMLRPFKKIYDKLKQKIIDDVTQLLIENRNKKMTGIQMFGLLNQEKSQVTCQIEDMSNDEIVSSRLVSLR